MAESSGVHGDLAWLRQTLTLTHCRCLTDNRDSPCIMFDCVVSKRSEIVSPCFGLSGLSICSCGLTPSCGLGNHLIQMSSFPWHPFPQRILSGRYIASATLRPFGERDFTFPTSSSLASSVIIIRTLPLFEACISCLL